MPGLEICSGAASVPEPATFVAGNPGQGSLWSAPSKWEAWVSESDSFLHEITEEVRRDKLVRMLRKNAVWIGLVLVLIIVGAAGWEWRRSSLQAAAEARGAALWAALQRDDAAERRAALREIELQGDTGAAIIAMHRAAAALADEDPQATVDMLRAAASDAGAGEGLRDAARLTMVATGGDLVPRDERMAILDQMAVEGHPMRGLALEQRALIHLDQGDDAAAASDLFAALSDQTASEAQRQRIAALLTIIGLPPQAQEAAESGNG